jgi:aldehyde dehydrogenase (NAD+)
VQIRNEPVGAVGPITPWNGPVGATAFKLGPALAAGCTGVVKPAPGAPLTTGLVADCVIAAAIPEGVVNMLPGERDAGEHLVKVVHRG